MYTRAGSVHERESRMHRFMSKRVAEIVYERSVESRRHHDRRRKSIARRENTERTVLRIAARRVHARGARKKSESVRPHPILFLESHLIEQMLPKRIIVRQLRHHGKRKPARR